MKRWTLASIAALMVLAGCASPDTGSVPIVVTKETQVAVAVTCTPNLGPEPQYADAPSALAAAANIFERVKLLLAGREQRIERDKAKTAALERCGTSPK